MYIDYTIIPLYPRLLCGFPNEIHSSLLIEPILMKINSALLFYYFLSVLITEDTLCVQIVQ